MFAKTLIAYALATMMASATASDYFLVVPLPAKRAALDAISVTLRAVSLPVGTVGVAYPGLDLNTALSVTGDPAYAPGAVTWRIGAGAMPGGLTLAQGRLSGTPVAETP